eukprot:scaffold1536_cov166-Amphora_coffeaeformis.AAC.2
MFGGQQNSSPFGGGGFGQQNTAPAFGSPAPAPGGIFGQPAPAPFGAPAPAFGSTGGFGAPATSTPFGASAAPSGGLFGAPAPSSGFGGGFGQPAPAPGGLFGQPAPAPSAFGAPAPSGGLFGQAPAPSSSMFGSTTSGFGQTSTFGAAPAPSAFGAPAGGGLFGAPAPAPTGGLFGSSAAPAPFGGPAPAPFGSTFGSSSPAPFGASAPAGGGLFGSPAPAAGGMFGAATPGAAAGNGTRGVQYQPTTKQDGQSSINFQSITAMQQYEGKSFEELRMEDYQQGNRGTPSSTPTASNTTGSFFGAAPAPSGGGLFGSSAPAPSGGLFGSAPAPSGFGAPAPAPGGGLFGAPAPSPSFGGFGSSNPAPAPFGAAPAPFGGAAPAPFGAPAPGGSLFGAPGPAPAFGAPAPSGGLFGSSSVPAPFGAPAPGGLFGSTAPAPSFGGGGGLFGSTAPAPFGASPSPGFGAPSSGGLFGQPAPAPTSLFGQTPSSGFGVPAPSGGFGFNAPSQPQGMPMGGGGSGIPANAQIVPPAMDQMFNQRMAALEKMRENFEKNRAWQPDNTWGSNTTPTSLASRNATFNNPPPPYAISSATMLATSSSPPSATRLRPRGFPRPSGADDNAPTAKISELGRGSNMSGHSPIMQLVVKPNSLNKPRLRIHAPTGVSDETITLPPNDTSDSPAADARSRGGPSLTPLASNHASSPTTHSTTRTHTDPSSAATALYHEAISDEPDATAPPTPVTRQSPSGSHLVPKLTKADYETSPSIEELGKKSEADLAAVENFVVRRPGFGEVAWEGSVDVRGVDLDRVVSIQKKDVSVYSEEEDEGTKPRVGTKLNRPAVITYEEVYPGDDAQASKATMDKFVVKLQKRCEKMGADHVGYERSTGTWKIRVSHFSRYGLYDEDSEDEEVHEVNLKKIVGFAGVGTPVQPKTILRRKQTPHVKASRARFDIEMESSESFENEDPRVSEREIEEMVNKASKQAFDEVQDLVKELNSPMLIDDSHTTRRSEGKIDEEHVVEEGKVPILNVLVDGSVFMEALTKKSSITSRLQSKRSGVNLGARSGKLFCAGWHPKGLLCVPTNGLGALQEIRPVFGEPISFPVHSLRLFTSICTRDSQNIECCSLRMPFSVLNGGDEKSHAALLIFLETIGSDLVPNDEAQLAYKLLAALLEAPSTSSSLVIADSGRQESYVFNERRNQALLQWLIDANKAETVRETEASLKQNDVACAVFAAVAGGDIAMTAKIAMDAGHIDLAIALSTGTEGRVFLAGMLARAVQTGEANNIPQYLLRTLRSVGGESTLEESLHRTGSNLSWRQRWALKLLQNPSTGLRELISSYDEDVKKGIAPFPSAKYTGTNSDVESVQYRILRCVADPRSLQLCEVVDTTGFTANPHDLSHSYFLACGLVAAGYAAAGHAEFEKMSSGFEAQLINQGTWEWAVPVCLATPYVSGSVTTTKIRRAHEYVLRYYDPSKHPHQRTFLESDVGVSSAWFSEALAYKASDATNFAENVLKVSPEQASLAIEKHWLPYEYFMDSSDSNNILNSIPPGDSSESLPSAVVQLRRLQKKVQSLGGGALITASDITFMSEECDRLETKFSEAAAEGITQGNLFPFPATYRIDSKRMLRDALGAVKKLRFQLAGLS